MIEKVKEMWEEFKQELSPNFWEFIGKLCIVVLILAVCALSISTYEVELTETYNTTLLKENKQLELDLAEATNEIYELKLDLARTEKTLAVTANELQELKEIEHNYKELNLEYVGEYLCTAYCTENYAHICGGGGNTASGAPVTADVSVAATDLGTFPYGTVIYIEGIGIRIVQDTGGFSKNKLDIAVKTHKEATHWKNSKHKVWIIKEGE